MVKKIFWTQNQREILEGLEQGKTEEELVDEGYGKESIHKVQGALSRGQRPRSQESGNNGDNPPEDTKNTRRGGDGSKSDKITTILAQAQQIKYVPKVYTADYTPIMRAGQAAAIREWKWREDMPLENFLDTVIYHFFKDRGITLAGYFVEREEEVNAS